MRPLSKIAKSAKSLHPTPHHLEPQAPQHLECQTPHQTALGFLPSRAWSISKKIHHCPLKNIQKKNNLSCTQIVRLPPKHVLKFNKS